jgi:hypothetical protein
MDLDAEPRLPSFRLHTRRHSAHPNLSGDHGEYLCAVWALMGEQGLVAGIPKAQLISGRFTTVST